MPDTWTKYYEEVAPRLGKRRDSFDTMFTFLGEFKHPTIVETGTYREQDNYEGDGCSTLLFDKYIECYGGNLISIDIDPEACQLSRNATTEALVIERDSVEALGEMEGRVDLLYLDSCGSNIDINYWDNDWQPSAHHLKELFAAKNIIFPGTLIVVDDNIMTAKGNLMGKGRLIYELMESLGIEPLIFGYQLGWVWEEPWE